MIDSVCGEVLFGLSTRLILVQSSAGRTNQYHSVFNVLAVSHGQNLEDYLLIHPRGVWESCGGS